MADPKDSRVANVPSEIGGSAPTGGFLRSIVDIFVDPFKVFARIDAGLSWWKPFMLVCVVAMILELSHASVPAEADRAQPEGSERGAASEGGRGIRQVRAADAHHGADRAHHLYLIVAGIVHLVINIMSSRSNFKKTLSLISFCGIITIIEQIIGTVVLRMRGVESVESAADLKFSLSLAPLLGEGKGLLNAVLQSLSIFQIWYYVVLVLGIAAIFKISRKAAIIPVLPIWIFSVLMLWIGGKFGGGMG